MLGIIVDMRCMVVEAFTLGNSIMVGATSASVDGTDTHDCGSEGLMQ